MSKPSFLELENFQSIKFKNMYISSFEAKENREDEQRKGKRMT
jgi:hypothetical protein